MVNCCTELPHWLSVRAVVPNKVPSSPNTLKNSFASSPSTLVKLMLKVPSAEAVTGKSCVRSKVKSMGLTGVSPSSPTLASEVSGALALMEMDWLLDISHSSVICGGIRLTTASQFPPSILMVISAGQTRMGGLLSTKEKVAVLVYLFPQRSSTIKSTA